MVELEHKSANEDVNTLRKLVLEKYEASRASGKGKSDKFARIWRSKLIESWIKKSGNESRNKSDWRWPWDGTTARLLLLRRPLSLTRVFDPHPKVDEIRTWASTPTYTLHLPLMNITEISSSNEEWMQSNVEQTEANCGEPLQVKLVAQRLCYYFGAKDHSTEISCIQRSIAVRII